MVWYNVPETSDDECYDAWGQSQSEGSSSSSEGFPSPDPTGFGVDALDDGLGDDDRRCTNHVSCSV